MVGVATFDQLRAAVQAAQAAQDALDAKDVLDEQVARQGQSPGAAR